MRQTIRLLLITLFSAAAVAAVGAEPTRGRWAIVATNPVVKSGLPDLLTVKLSQDESMQLVERERLRDATRELQLESLVKAENVHQRLQLGKTLGADSLIVLSTEQRDGQQVLRVVVSDSTLGVRLWDGRFLNDDSDVEGLADQCVAVVAEVRQRFAGGIQRIFAVPPFLSENFEQRFDYLQSRHRDVLSSALMAHAGVAVVEIEEARAILRELEDTLSAGIERPIATIVEGEYRVTAADEDNQRRIELQIELVSGERREQIRKTFQLGTVGHWLTTSLANRLLSDGAGNTDSLSAKTQKEILARHAQRFAELGDWERSIALREAALVLNPNDALQRGLLISEYQYSIAPIIFANWHGARVPEARAAALQHVADDYVVALNHLEYLVRNKLITRADAIGLLYTQCWYLRNAVGEALPWDPAKYAALQPACIAQREFFREVGAELDRLSPGRLLPERLSTPFYGIHFTLTQHALNDVVFNNYSADSLESLRYVLERIVPEDAKASARVLGRMTRFFSSERRLDSDAYRNELKVYYEKRDALRQDLQAASDVKKRKRLSDEMAALRLPKQPIVGPQEEQAREAWLPYLRRLTQSDREVVKLYGHWGLLKAPVKEESYFTSQARIASLPPLIENMERQLAEVKQLHLIGDQALTPLESELTRTNNWLRSHTAPPSSPKPSPSPTNESVVRESFGRMRFDPISLVLEGEQNPGPRPLIKGMLQCGESCDAYWTKDQFFVMHQPGVLRELKLTDSESEHGLFRGVAWDGECIWLFAQGQGIVAVRPDGTRLATFNQTEHLPGYWKGFSLLGLSPRRALIVASFGKSNRAWCGILEVDESGKQSVNIFFEAKYVAEGRLPKDAAADPKTAFQPVWIHRLQSRHGKSSVLVGRRDVAGALQIDLDTLDVSVSGYDTHKVGRQAFFSHDGHLLVSRGGNQLIHYFPPGRDGSVRRHVLANINPYVDQLLLHEGWLYVPGRVWFRLDPDKRKPERLQPWPSHLPGYYASLKGGVSAHYGLIAYYLYKRPLYQITILEENPEDQTKGSEQ